MLCLEIVFQFYFILLIFLQNKLCIHSLDPYPHYPGGSDLISQFTNLSQLAKSRMFSPPLRQGRYDAALLLSGEVQVYQRGVHRHTQHRGQTLDGQGQACTVGLMKKNVF